MDFDMAKEMLIVMINRQDVTTIRLKCCRNCHYRKMVSLFSYCFLYDVKIAEQLFCLLD